MSQSQSQKCQILCLSCGFCLFYDKMLEIAGVLLQYRIIKSIDWRNHAYLYKQAPMLEKHLQRQGSRSFLRPIAAHTQEAFSQFILASQGKSIIIDSGCGTGQSTHRLAEVFPEEEVWGLDRSKTRLSRHKAHFEPLKNKHFLQVNLVDFWRLMAKSEVSAKKHFLYYPNPYPKSGDLTRRFHGMPIFSAMLKLSNEHEARSNKLEYLLEMAFVAVYCSYSAELFQIEPLLPSTAFEKKYRERGEPIYLLKMCSKLA